MDILNKKRELHRILQIYVAICMVVFIAAGIALIYFLNTWRYSQQPERVSTTTEPVPTADVIKGDEPFQSPIPHPGKIVIRSFNDKESKTVSIDELPVDARFVFYKSGKIVSYKESFDKVVAVVEVEITNDLRIKKYGENHKLLDTVKMELGEASKEQ